MIGRLIKLTSFGLLVGLILLTSACTPVTAQSAVESGDESGLQGQVEALQAQVDSLAAGQVSMAQYIMDSAGFHGMEEALAESGSIDPAYPGTVSRVHKVLAATVFPHDLAEQGAAFTDLVGELAEALAADDSAAAARLAAEVHEAQHDFSHAIDDWLGAAGEHDH